MNPKPSLDQLGLKYVADPEAVTGKNYQGGDKTSLHHNYTVIYEQLFSPWRDQSVNLLELGVYTGRSLAMWSDYFPHGMICGVDINLHKFNKTLPSLEELGAFSNRNYHVLECSVLEDRFKLEMAKLPQFEIIIDDADHRPKTQWENFLYLFVTKLSWGGIYVIEDIEKPQGLIQLFTELMTCVANKKHGFAKNHKRRMLAEIIDSIEIRSNQIIIRRVGPEHQSRISTMLTTPSS